MADLRQFPMTRKQNRANIIREAVTNPPRTVPEQMQSNMNSNRQDDAAYEGFLKAGSQRSGTFTASQTGAMQMAKQNLFDKLANQQLLEQKAKRDARVQQAQKLT